MRTASQATSFAGALGGVGFDTTGAACVSADPELFFPLQGQTTLADAAKAVCARCDIVAACRAWALDQPQLSGVWGGMTETERYRWRRAHPGPQGRTCQHCGASYLAPGGGRPSLYCRDACRRMATARRRTAGHAVAPPPPQQRCSNCGSWRGPCTDPDTCDEARAKRMEDQ